MGNSDLPPQGASRLQAAWHQSRRIGPRLTKTFDDEARIRVKVCMSNPFGNITSCLVSSIALRIREDNGVGMRCEQLQAHPNGFGYLRSGSVLENACYVSITVLNDAGSIPLKRLRLSEQDLIGVTDLADRCLMGIKVLVGIDLVV